jgi:hypothetical protein
MAPLPLVNSIEILFALLSDYLREDGKRSTAGLEAYVQWLRSHGRPELADIASNNPTVGDSLQFLMEQHHH